jgi:hypothetical protein
MWGERDMMRFRLAIEFSIGDRGKWGISMPTDWEAKAAKYLRERSQNIQLEKETRRENRRLIDEQAPGLCSQIREFIKQKISALNRNYGKQVARVVDVVDKTDVWLEHDGTTVQLTAKFEYTTAHDAISWSYTGNVAEGVGGGSCSFYIGNNSTVFLRQGNETKTPESLADEMLDGLLGIPYLK